MCLYFVLLLSRSCLSVFDISYVQVLGSLITHIGSGLTHEVGAALDALLWLATKFARELIPLSSFMNGQLSAVFVLDFVLNLRVMLLCHYQCDHIAYCVARFLMISIAKGEYSLGFYLVVSSHCQLLIRVFLWGLSMAGILDYLEGFQDSHLHKVYCSILLLLNTWSACEYLVCKLAEQVSIHACWTGN